MHICEYVFMYIYVYMYVNIYICLDIWEEKIWREKYWGIVVHMWVGCDLRGELESSSFFVCLCLHGFPGSSYGRLGLCSQICECMCMSMCVCSCVCMCVRVCVWACARLFVWSVCMRAVVVTFWTLYSCCKALGQRLIEVVKETKKELQNEYTRNEKQTLNRKPKSVTDPKNDRSVKF